MLDSSIPNAHVLALIGPLHDSIAVTLVLAVVALIAISRLPLEDTIAVLLVLLVHALV